MKRKIIKVAITGGIGSGKSTVAQYLREKGYPVFSCDEIYKEIYTTEEYQLELLSAFPDCAVNGRIDKQLLTQRVFSDKNALSKLNEIAHKRIMSELYERMENVAGEIAFAEVPLLFEGGYERDFDQVIVVLRNREKRINAAVLRDKTTSEAVLKRINSQYDYDNEDNLKRFKEQGYVCIKNDFDEKNLIRQVDDFLSSALNIMKQ